MMERAQLMRHGVAYTEECVCKSHTRHSCRVCHLLPCLYIGLTVFVSGGQIFENNLQSLNCKPVGVVGCHYRSIRFKRVGNRIYTGSGGKTLGRRHMQIGVYYSHIRH